MPFSLCSHPVRIFYSPADNPLENFYIPALTASVRYDRSAGYFSSSALAVAAAGVARLIQNGGRMRLLVGAELSEADVEAIRQGHDLQDKITERLLERFPDPQDALMRERLAVLAWMVAEGTLEIKVVLPKDADGLPIPALQAQDYYHPKSGIFTDAEGDQVAFSGSVNESETGWKHNYEQFAVYTSWGEGKSYLPLVIDRFEDLWSDREPDWIALPVPKAVEERLLKYRPMEAPVRDPLEPKPVERPCKEAEKPYIAGSPQAERILFQFLRDAPYLPNAAGLGAATAAITPWPHQSRVADRILNRFPERALLCDEVGLGKTIEAGLVLRQLLLSGWVKRVLILAPKSVLKQWQEELYEKFALSIPRYDSGKFLDVDDQVLPISARENSEGGASGIGNPWDACDQFIASSQLAKRSDRRAQVVSARGWDLLIVDEAHHARRKDFKERIYRPNQLLGLLNDLKAQSKIGSLLLMTATPMQIHPLEVWDLLSVVGMGGRWGADEDNFLGFFQEMRKPFNQAAWEFVYDLVRDYLVTGGQIDETFRGQVLADIGPVQWSTLEELPFRPGKRNQAIRQLSPKAEPYVKEMARRHTPLNHSIFRNTRELLRAYEKRGILKAQVPRRRPHIERVQMRLEEQALYNRIDEYITHFYHKYENERRGLGFVMTVYRRRLTSSFYAVRCSLERRLAYLKGQIDPEKQFTDDDIEQDELDLDIGEEILDPVQRDFFQAELEYVQDFIQQLQLLSVSDSKMEELKDELDKVFRVRNTVLIFTQYADTMDYLRGQLCEVYGSQVACYSGRGGEMWNGITWVPVTKEEVKTKFREGEVRILLGTESASEGLNLQTCGVLINYDMPWNPMRVEQRIGRIDRIGQEHKEVWITNYFYKDTIEDQIYQRLADRINWFEVVVGNLQPILAEVGEATRRLAMLLPSEREMQLEKEIEALRQRLQNREIEALNLDEYLDAETYQPTANSPVTLEQIEYLFTQSQTTGCYFQADPELPGAYWLSWNNQRLHVTFSPSVFDEHPDTIRFLTYGSPLFAEILASIPEPEPLDTGGLVFCRVSAEFDLRGWYTVGARAAGSTDMELRALTGFLALKDWLTNHPEPAHATAELLEGAQANLKADYDSLAKKQAEIVQMRYKAEYLTWRVKAQNLLLHAAMVEIALGRSPEMFETEVFPSTFLEGSVLGLQRHGFPWRPLLALAYDSGMKPEETDPYFIKIHTDTRESLKGRFNQLTQEARRVVESLHHARQATEKGQPEGIGRIERRIYG
jgi:SNF2 family DNA or RNA helicase